MRVGSLFSGIGGLDLGLERAGMELAWQVEIDDYCRRVLAKHWPDVARYGDIREVDLDQLERVDLICGGFPCQPVSTAGHQRLGTADERWLWPDMARVVRVLRPLLILMENVPGLLTLGFDEVASDLATLGYDFEWESIPAAAVGAPHLRDRVFIVAHASGIGRGEGPRVLSRVGATGRRATLAHTDSQGPQRRWLRGPVAERSWWSSEPDVGRVAHGAPNRVERLRGLGNAVVPQVAEWVGRRIMEAA